jgi:predicted AlkP superfamily pyrophosphatase or phosphodiesterase
MNKLTSFLVAVGILALAACATPPVQPPSAHTGRISATTAPVILISLDGFRADYLDRGLTPNIAALAASGVRTAGMRPAFPSLTFPNHYTLVTGLYPDHHGMVSNTMEDPAIPGGHFAPSAQGDERWWDEATPIWISAERQGMGAATMFWPGSDQIIHGMRPNYWKPYDKSVSPDARVDTVLGWLDLPIPVRPSFLTLYLEDVDSAGHASGPDSDGVNDALRRVDAAIGRLADGLRQRGILDKVNLIIVADHGMAATSPDRVDFLDDWADAKFFRLISGGAVAGVSPQPGHTAEVERALLAPHDHAKCWRKAELPPHLHYGHNPRVPPIVCLAEIGWIVATHQDAAEHKGFALGQHGYDGAEPAMRALFVAHGPAFRAGLAITEPFDNVDVYPIMTHLLGIAPEPNDGNLADVAEMLNAGM